MRRILATLALTAAALGVAATPAAADPSVGETVADLETIANHVGESANIDVL